MQRPVENLQGQPPLTRFTVDEYDPPGVASGLNKVPLADEEEHQSTAHVRVARKRATRPLDYLSLVRRPPVMTAGSRKRDAEFTSLNEGLVMRTNRFALAALATLAALPDMINQARAQEVVSSYVTFYGFDDNDDGNPTHLGTDVISHAAVHSKASEDLGTYERPGTLATDVNFLTPGTKVYVPALERYYVMEDTYIECSEDWSRSKAHVDLYVSGTGPELAACEDRLTLKSTKIIIEPPANLPVRAGSACDNGVGG